MSITAADVSAVLVTRGDVDLSHIIESIAAAGIAELIVWNNAEREDLGAYGRYAAIAEAKHDVIYTQDDDVIVGDIRALLVAYEPGTMTINHPFGKGFPLDIPWNGKGGVFHRDLPGAAFARYLDKYPFDRYFTHHVCDGVVGLFAPIKALDVGHTSLPAAISPGRISTTAGWYEERRPEILRRCRALGSAW